MFALLVLVPLGSGGLVLKLEQRGQVDPWRHPGCPQITNGSLFTIPVWPPDTIGRTVQVAALLPDQFYSYNDERCVGRNFLDADFREVGPAILAGFEEGIARGWLHNITFSIEFWDTQCDNAGANDANENLLKKYRPHVMFGPSCDEALTAVAFNQYSSRKFPLLTAGGFGTIFTSQKYIPGSSYYMLTKTGISYRDVAKTFVRFMQENKWQKFLLAVKEQERLEWSGDRSSASSKAVAFRTKLSAVASWCYQHMQQNCFGIEVYSNIYKIVIEEFQNKNLIAD